MEKNTRNLAFTQKSNHLSYFMEDILTFTLPLTPPLSEGSRG